MVFQSIKSNTHFFRPREGGWMGVLKGINFKNKILKLVQLNIFEIYIQFYCISIKDKFNFIVQ